MFKSTFSKPSPETSKGMVIACILFAALIGFEMFNFDTTRYALRDVLGELTFLQFEWAGILAFAFCSIDFAGLIHLFTPERGKDEPKEVWLLTGAWILGATMNALMTWYAVVLALAVHPLSATHVDATTLTTYIPIFIAILVWLTRLLFIGSLSVAGDRLLHQHPSASKPTQRPLSHTPRRERPTPPPLRAPELNGLAYPHETDAN